MSTDMLDLPIELISKIFSYLDSDDVVKLSIVCSKFNNAAKDASLWRRCQISTFGKNLEKVISSFCLFFSSAPHIRELSIWTHSSISVLSSESVNSLNTLFKNLQQLYCLNTNIKLTEIALPPSLRHLSCEVIDPIRMGHNRDGAQFAFLASCRNIECLYIDNVRAKELTNSLKSSLLTYKLTLRSFYLKVEYFDEGWIPLIANCDSLKELGIESNIPTRVNLASLFVTSLNSRLEVLFVKNVIALQSFQDFIFPELKHLAIAEPLTLNVEDCLPAINGMPKLESLCLSGKMTDFDISNICNLLQNNKTLKYIMIQTNFKVITKDQRIFDDTISDLNRECTFEDQWQVAYNEFLDKDNLMSMYKCNCWDSAENLRHKLNRQTQRKLLLADKADEEDLSYFPYYESDDSDNFLDNFIEDPYGAYDEDYYNYIHSERRRWDPFLSYY